LNLNSKKGVRPCTCLCIDLVYLRGYPIVTRPCGLSLDLIFCSINVEVHCFNVFFIPSNSNRGMVCLQTRLMPFISLGLLFYTKFLVQSTVANWVYLISDSTKCFVWLLTNVRLLIYNSIKIVYSVTIMSIKDLM
jgi:hypothetical protein